MIGVWMTPCKNGQCELSVRRDGINKIVIATQTPLTDAQAEELFWCVKAMQRSGKTLKGLLKEQGAKIGHWVSVNDGDVVAIDNDGFPERACFCSECKKYLVASDEYAVYGRYCPFCGTKMEGREVNGQGGLKCIESAVMEMEEKRGTPNDIKKDS